MSSMARGRAVSGRIGGAMALTMSPPAMVMAAPASVCAHVAAKSRGGTTMAATSTPICRMVRSGFLSAAAIGQRGAQRHDLAALERGLAPRRAGDRAAVHSDRHGGWQAGPFAGHQIGHSGATGKNTGAHLAPLGRQSMGPEIGDDLRRIVDPRAFVATATILEGSYLHR